MCIYKWRLCSLLPHAQHEGLSRSPDLLTTLAIRDQRYLITHNVLLCLLEKTKAPRSSQRYALYYAQSINNLTYMGILGGEEPPQFIHLLSRWLQRLHISQTEDNSIPMSGTVQMVIAFD